MLIAACKIRHLCGMGTLGYGRGFIDLACGRGTLNLPRITSLCPTFSLSHSFFLSISTSLGSITLSSRCPEAASIGHFSALGSFARCSSPTRQRWLLRQASQYQGLLWDLSRCHCSSYLIAQQHHQGETSYGLICPTVLTCLPSSIPSGAEV